MTGIFKDLESVRLETLNDSQIYRLSDVIERALLFLEFLTSNKYHNLETINQTISYKNTSSRITNLDIIASNLGTKTTVGKEDEIFRQIWRDIEPAKFAGTSDCSMEGALTCGVCFDEFSSAVDLKNKKVVAVALRLCCHWFCVECWSHHLTTQVRQGVHNIKCPVRQRRI